MAQGEIYVGDFDYFHAETRKEGKHVFSEEKKQKTLIIQRAA
jgi:hypothetical protein